MLENPPLPLWRGRSLRWSFWWSFWVEIELIKVAKELRPGDLLNNLKSDYHVHLQNAGETERSHSSWNKAHTSWCTPPGKYFATNQVLNSWPPSKNINTCWCSYMSWPNLEVFGGKPKCINHIACKNITESCFFSGAPKHQVKPMEDGFCGCFFPGVLSGASRLNPLELLVCRWEV